ncbi:hypothetical protein [Corynebacterium riegelii]|uniref:hypothetical protein n=1 Tax=Corynebacterium riegelii TaxID=156976 RepID=UPI00191FC86B|nr:hypothetical protein [Corynebacterium riegelii]MDK7179976.1 hypothetical protein [Corynebacterium riegelii]QQU84166.1 hypothetical protein I6I71_00730 [Corynebacterium riegelii]
MARLDNVRDAFRKVIDFSGYPEECFLNEAYEDSKAYFFMTNDEQPEGTPSFLIFKDSGEIVEKNMVHWKETTAWIESPGTRLISIPS